MARHDDDDDDRYGNACRRMLPDGAARVPLMMRDGMSPVQRAIMEDKVRRGFDDSQARHRPGPVFTDAAGLERKAEAYRQMCDDLQNAWRTPAADDAADRRRTRKGVARDPFIARDAVPRTMRRRRVAADQTGSLRRRWSPTCAMPGKGPRDDRCAGGKHGSSARKPHRHRAGRNRRHVD